MRTIESLTYDAYERHILVFHSTGGGRFAAYSKSPALWVERTQDGRYHLCDANGSFAVGPAENVDAIVEDWEACVA